MIRRWMKGRKHGECGQAMVEFALVIPILLLVVMGCIEFSWYFTTHYNLGQYSRALGENIKEPFIVARWNSASGGEKPSWLTNSEKADWSFDDYDEWIDLPKPTDGNVIDSSYGYMTWDFNYASRMDGANINLDTSRMDAKVYGGWFRKLEAVGIPKARGGTHAEGRTKVYYADIIVEIEYEYKPLTFVGDLVFSVTSKTMKLRDHYTYPSALYQAS